MAHCIRNFFKKRKSSSKLSDKENNEIKLHEIVYSSVEKNTLNFVNSANELLEQMSSHDTLRHINIQKINIPRIVLIGTQSSGKSSLVNRFIGMNILPTGDNMVTRTPINIRLSTVSQLNENIANIYI